MKLKHFLMEQANAGDNGGAGSGGDDGIDNAGGVSEIEQEAVSDGWISEEAYKDKYGHTRGWTSAEEYVDKGRHINRLLKAKIERQENEHKKQMSELQTALKQFKELSKSQLTIKQTQLETALSDLKSARATAIREGDGDLVNEIDDRIDTAKIELKAVKEVPAQKEEPQLDPEIKADLDRWIERNSSWYNKDMESTKFANDLAAKLKRQGETRVGSAFLRVLEDELRELRPEIFNNQNRNKPNMVDGGSKQSAASNDNSSVEAFKRGLSEAERYGMKALINDGVFKSEREYMIAYKELN